jgi:hypothetical protein
VIFRFEFPLKLEEFHAMTAVPSIDPARVLHDGVEAAIETRALTKSYGNSAAAPYPPDASNQSPLTPRGAVVLRTTRAGEVEMNVEERSLSAMRSSSSRAASPPICRPGLIDAGQGDGPDGGEGGVVVSGDRDVPGDGQPGLRDRGLHAHGGDVRPGEDGGRRVRPAQQLPRAGIPSLLGVAGGDDIDLLRQPSCPHRLPVALGADGVRHHG